MSYSRLQQNFNEPRGYSSAVAFVAYSGGPTIMRPRSLAVISTTEMQPIITNGSSGHDCVLRLPVMMLRSTRRRCPPPRGPPGHLVPAHPRPPRGSRPDDLSRGGAAATNEGAPRLCAPAYQLPPARPRRHARRCLRVCRPAAPVARSPDVSGSPPRRLW